MWDLGNVWAEGNNACTPANHMASSYLSVMHEIHVLLVDHESDALLNTAKMLEMCQYKVTLVELASSAITMLISGNANFDMVIANINSPDIHGFKLVQQADKLGIPIVLLSGDDNAFIAMRAIESGALLYLKKPTTLDMIRSLWQYVLKEKTREIRENERLMAMANNGAQGIDFKGAMQQREENPNDIDGNNMFLMDDKGKSKKRPRGRKEDGYDSINHHRVKRKVCTEWTQELHEKFLKAVEQLGEGRCFPKEILELMDVPGLTRMQVASHLQKCRNDNWRSPEERKSSCLSMNSASSDANSTQSKPRRFGSMPRTDKPMHDPGQAQETPAAAPSSQCIKTTQSEITNTRVESSCNNGNAIHTPSHEQHGFLVPQSGGGAANSQRMSLPPPLHPLHASNTDEFFGFSEMECLIQNLHQGPSAGITMINNPNSSYNDHSVYHDRKYSMQERSHWSSETISNLGSEGSADQTKGN